MHYSGLALRLTALLRRLGLADSDEALRGFVHEAVATHFLEQDTPVWMDQLLDAVAQRRLTGRYVKCPGGYPDGESGLANVLADLETHFSLGICDQGEDFFWPMPQLDLALLVSREGTRAYVLRPWQGRWREYLIDGRIAEGTLRAGRPAGRWRYTFPRWRHL